MHKMMLVVSLKTAEGTLCMVLHSIAQHTISMVLHSIVQYGIAWLSLSRQRKGLQWPLQPNKEAPTSCLQNPEIKNQKKKNSGRDSSGHFTITKRPRCMSWVSCLRNTQKNWKTTNAIVKSPIFVVSKEQFQGCGRNFISLLPLPLRF